LLKKIKIQNMNFEKGNGLITAVIQDAQTDKVLMVGYMNESALQQTIAENKVCFFSRTKNRLWTKGEESGNFLNVVSIVEDCDSDTLLIKANPIGPTCHTGADTCFNETNEGKAAFLNHLKGVIHSRKIAMDDSSYVASLFKKGLNKIAQKVGEEAVELVIEAKDNDAELFKNEAADLLFHYMILLEAKGIDFDEIIDVLRERQK
jgi:phosphoribosyl-AMP cyclohydrolase / phosphoribosyl-ATP pyrophosphohydrolase